ncbi:MAG: bifunctional phosphopantothenoylcysteine decarboxylase/phosphopantothenate--cysteine ligase CoaBC [Pelagibacterales bacterium]|nr:bifunctional phosphopantothenoylcysteine decarboxylase/phosphopantothenate--cysteine ligase CoaBC [Pelagibacterales bacterium]|tara:strand:+ start:237 stop:1460 length:1224 start_codon:yes stop_codon:yes gene_type:complete
MKKKKILLIITGSIAAYKSLYLIRILQDAGFDLNCIITKSAEKFITSLTVSSLLGNKVYNDLFSLDDETEMGHIKLAKEHDLIIVAPASANFISKISHGLADDLASSVMLATKLPTFIFPAMNSSMLNNFFTKNNFMRLKQAGIKVFGTESGELACGDVGLGRMKEPEEILKISKEFFLNENNIFKGVSALITAGPTQESIDPVRFLSNYSSGKQGYALAEQLADMGANVCLVSGPTKINKPKNVKNFIKVKTADEMFEKCLKNIPKDLFISVAAVSDWKIKNYSKNKIKKKNTKISFQLTENRDILKFISTHNKRPKLVVGFAAETNEIEKNAKLKLKRKKCDLIVANNVASSENIMGGDMNSAHIYSNSNLVAKYQSMKKVDLSKKLLTEIIHPLLHKKIGENTL